MQTLLKITTALSLMLFIFTAQSKTINNKISDKYKNIANQVMDAQYGKNAFDNNLYFWKYTHKNPKYYYKLYFCLNVVQTQVVNTKKGKKLLYILASGDK